MARAREFEESVLFPALAGTGSADANFPFAAETLEQLRFEQPGAVLITEKDAVKCEHLQANGVWCVVVDFKFDADSTARLMRLVLRDIGARA